jgi:putative integral membrane protein (TIGR02587 family)
MTQHAPNQTDKRDNREFMRALARAFGGALVFGLPLFMTMEMWWLGFFVEEWHLILLLVVNYPFLVGLSHYSGFEQSTGLLDDVLSAFVAYAVGIVTATVMLALLAVISPGMPLNEVVTKIALQAVPGSIGALLARSQFGSSENDERQAKDTGYWGELFIMQVGAVFVGLNLAPTDEVTLIAFQMSELHAIALVLLALTTMHAFVYAVGLRGQVEIAAGTPRGRTFLRFTIVGYAGALLISLFVLWMFGRTEGTGLKTVLMMAVVLSFPNAIGAAAARLIL